MIQRKRLKYTREFKLEAVRLASRPGYLLGEVAAQLSLHPNLLRDWKRKHEAEGAQAFPGNGNLSPQDEELRRLRAENRQLRMVNEILKKATAFFAKESP